MMKLSNLDRVQDLHVQLLTVDETIASLKACENPHLPVRAIVPQTDMRPGPHIEMGTMTLSAVQEHVQRQRVKIVQELRELGVEA